MNADGENVYMKCRHEAGLSAEDAAEKIGISLRSLRNYEAFIYGTGTGVRPKDEVVLAMAKVYDSFELAYRHLAENTPLGRAYLPEIDFSEDLAISFLRNAKELDDLADGALSAAMREAILDDGEITEDELEAVRPYQRELAEAVYAGLVLLLRSQKIKKDPCGAQVERKRQLRNKLVRNIPGFDFSQNYFTTA